MKPWDIYSWLAPGMTVPHPAVIVSGPERTARKQVLNVLICSSHRKQRPPGVGEVLLDAADGLDWETLCRCDLLQVADRDELQQKRGQVTMERRREIARKVVQCTAFGML